MHAIDVRCSATLGDPSLEQGRCQECMGHDGAHAVMFTRAGHRVVRTRRSCDLGNLDEHESGFEMTPWLLGFPTPAWIEPTQSRL
jgi:hypothetical protein